MVELAHLTGDRQNVSYILIVIKYPLNFCGFVFMITYLIFFFQDLKDERRRSQMAVARQILERSTMMLLTSSKVTNASKLYEKKRKKILK